MDIFKMFGLNNIKKPLQSKLKGPGSNLGRSIHTIQVLEIYECHHEFNGEHCF
jgi:hypothetical protein